MDRSDRVQAAKAYFGRIRKINSMIGRLNETAADMRAAMTSTVRGISGVRVGGSRQSDAMGAALARIDEMEEQIGARIRELAELRMDAFERISRVDSLDRQNVLIARYIQLKKWEDIADELCFSIQWVYGLHRRGLEEFAEKNSDVISQ